MSGDSDANTSSETVNKTANLNNEGGFQFLESDGNTVVTTDFDAVELSFDAIEDTTREAFDFSDNVNERSLDAIESSNKKAFDFAYDSNSKSFGLVNDALNAVGTANSKALDLSADANERIENISTRTIGTLKDFATTLKTGDLKTTKTIYLAGAGITGVVLLAFVVTNGIKGTK
jgi:hypothetical protein